MSTALVRTGERISAFFRATAPDPFVLAILLTAITFALGVAFAGAGPRTMLDAWQGGFWDLLAFSMQMCLILVTGHALASSPPIARALRALARTPRTGRQGVALVSMCAMGFGLVNWGLGLIVGAILARDVGRAMRDNPARAPYPLLAAAGYTGMLTWHGGLSGSAPLAAAQPEQLRALLGEALAMEVGALPVSATIFSPLNLVATGGLLLLVPIVMAALCPMRRAESAEPEPSPPEPLQPTPAPLRPANAPEWLERSPLVAWLVALPALLWLALRFADQGLDALTLNTANLLFLALGLALHASAGRYVSAVEDGVRGCAGIILQFPLYAGIMGMMRDSGLAASLSGWFVAIAGGSEGALRCTTFLGAGLVNLFVPSGGGQWAIQAPIAMQAAVDAGASPPAMVMAVAYGDQLTNMLQPFWALPLLAITGVKARDVVGYTAILMCVAAAWLMACLALF